MADPPSEFKYWAFISYSHRDTRWAAWLHRAIETYSGHKKLVGRASQHGEPVPRRLFPVFRDREELEGVPDLPTRIQAALVQSRHLIVICSPAAAASRWVNEEVRAFKTMGREDRVLAFIVDGSPSASDRPESGLKECFPEALRDRFDADGKPTGRRAEPGAADARRGKDGRQNALLKVLARLLGVNLDELKQRDLERRRLRWILLSSILLVIALVLAGLAVYAFQQKGVARSNAVEAEKQRDDANAQRLLALEALKKEAAAREKEAEARRKEEEARKEEEKARKKEEEARKEAVRQQGLAEERARVALSRQLASAALNALPAADKVDGDLASALLLAAQGVRASPTVEARSALLRTLQNSTYAMRILQGARSRNEGLGFSPDGKLLVVRDYHGGLALWDLNALQPLYDLSQQAHPALLISAFAFGTDGRTLALASSQRLLLWDLDRRRFRAESPRLSGERIVALAFDREVNRLASASGDGAIRLWSGDLQPIGEALRVTGGRPLLLAFCSGERLVVVSQDRRLSLLQLPDGRLLADQPLGTGRPLRDADIDARCRMLALSGEQPVLWDVGEVSASLTIPTTASGSVTAIAVAPDGRRVALAGRGVALSGLSGPVDARLLGHSSSVGAVAFSPDGRTLASAGEEDGRIILWEVGEGLMPLGRRVADRGRSAVSALAFSPDGTRLVSIDRDGMMSRREATNFTPQLGAVRVSRIGPASLAYGPDGRRFVIGNWDRTALACDGSGCQPLGRAPEEGAGGVVPANASAPRISHSPDGRFVALSWSKGPATFWDLESGRAAPSPLSGSVKDEGQQPVLFEYGPGASIAWSDAAGRFFLRAGEGTKVIRLAESAGAGVPVRLSFSPKSDNLLTVVVRADGIARLALWDGRSGRLVIRLPDIRATGGVVGFSPGGDLLAVGAGDEVMLWDVVSRKALSVRLRGHLSTVTSLAFSPDGKTLVTGGEEIIAWDVIPDAWIARACRMANRNLSPQEWADLTDAPYQPVCPGLPRAPAPGPAKERAPAPRS